MRKTLNEDDVLKEIDRWIGYLDEDMITRIKIGIKKLPSAQPTHNNTSNALKSLDCIDRQAAIDAVRDNESENYITINNLIDKDVVVALLENLPSAQPEQRWIPVSERLPDPLQEVLVTSTRGYVYTSRIVHGDFEYGGNVIAWMPLPEPYRGDNE